MKQHQPRTALTRIRALLITLGLVLVGIVGVAGPASAYTITCGSYGQTPSFACVSGTGYTGQQPWGYPVDANGHNCTNYASYRLWQNGVANPGNLGYAKDWDNNATAYGIPINNTAAVGAIAVWEANSGPALAEGHVAYVEAVTSSYIDISEDNYGGTTMWKRFYVGQSDWPDHFIHFKDVATGGGYATTFRANDGNLYLYDPVNGAVNTALGVAANTGPAVTPLNDGSFEVAFQAANSGSFYLYNTASGAATNTTLGMATGTSPAVARLGGGGYEAAFQDNTGNLWVYGSAGTHNLGLGMAAGTSPAITGLSDGSYEVAFQANSGSLYLYNSATGATNLALGMASGTNPSIAGLRNGGFEVSFQDNTGNLWVYGNGGTHDLALGMAPGTSPAITGLVDGTYKVAFQASGSGSLYFYDPANGAVNTALGVATGTSPSIYYMSGGGYEAAFQDNQGNLWVYGNAGNADTLLGVSSGTSPAIG